MLAGIAASGSMIYIFNGTCYIWDLGISTTRNIFRTTENICLATGFCGQPTINYKHKMPNMLA